MKWNTMTEAIHGTARMHWKILWVGSFALIAKLACTQGSALVGLGEQAHGYRSLNDQKVQQLVNLEEEGRIDAIIVESSFTGGIAAGGHSRLRDAMRAFVYPYWSADTVVHAFERMAASANERGLFLWGCDIQEDCRFHATTLALIDHTSLNAWRTELLRCDSVLDRYIGASPIHKPLSAQDRSLVQGIYIHIIEQLPVDEEHALLSRALRNRIWLCDLLVLTNMKKRMALRDSLMAANVLWILERFSSNDRLVFWAADLHVRRSHPSKPPKWCGEYLDRALGERYKAISVAHRRKHAKRFDRQGLVSPAVHMNERELVTPCP